MALATTYFNTKLYTGTGSSLALTGVGFQPDLVWIKSRSAATDHALYDSVRGTEKRLESNQTDAEATSDAGLTAFGSDGFTVNTLAQVNTNTATYAAWCWKKGATPGFDIVTGTKGAGTEAFAHSLGVKPEFLIVKNTNTAATDWFVTHKSLGAEMRDYHLHLNTNAAVNNTNDEWGTEPTSSNFYLTETQVANTKTFVAYLWSSVPGFSKFGSYTGNGNADGPYVHLGFSPAFLLIKCSSTTGNWWIVDSAKNTYNPTSKQSYANLSIADEDSASYNIDLTASGFKIRNTQANDNTNSATYIYAAWAAAPFKYARAR